MTIGKIKMMMIKRKAKKENFPILNVADRVLDRYREIVNNNEHKSDNEIILKLSRNCYAGEIIDKDDGYIVFAYGCLHIIYDAELNEIYNICNYKCYSDVKQGKIDFGIKNKLNKLYEIKEDK